MDINGQFLIFINLIRIHPPINVKSHPAWVEQHVRVLPAKRIYIFRWSLTWGAKLKFQKDTLAKRTLARNTQVYIKTSCEVGSLWTSPLCLYVTYLLQLMEKGRCRPAAHTIVPTPFGPFLRQGSTLGQEEFMPTKRHLCITRYDDRSWRLIAWS